MPQIPAFRSFSGEISPPAMGCDAATPANAGDPAAVDHVVTSVNGDSEVGAEGRVATGKEEKSRGKNGARSAWKKPHPPPVAAAWEARRAGGPIMGAESWPALEEARPKSSSDANVKPASLLQVAAAVENAGAVRRNRPPPTSPIPSQGSIGQRKSDGFGSNNPSNKHHPVRPHKPNPKRSALAHGAPPFPLALPYHPQPGQPILYPLVQQPPPLPVLEYAYQPFPPPFPSGGPHIVKSRCGTPMPVFVPTGQMGGIDGNRSFHAPPRGDPNMWYPNAASCANRQHNGHERSGRYNQTWRNQRAFNSRENINIQGIGPWNFRPVPPFFSQPPGFINGPSFPGVAPPFHCVTAAPLEVMRGPHYISHPPPPVYPMLMPEEVALRADIVKQVEYYFSDENLEKDGFLLSLLDVQGWVSISKIADFNRLKKMTENIPLIVDALRSSSFIEVQDDKIRKRNDWSKWLRTSVDSVHHVFSSQSHVAEGQFDETAPVGLENNELNKSGNNGIFGECSDSQESCKDQGKCLPAVNDSSKVESRNSSECINVKVLTADEPLACSEESKDTSRKSASGLFSETKLPDSCIECSCLSDKDSVSSVSDFSTSMDMSVSTESSQEISKSSVTADPELENVMAVSDVKPDMHLGGFSNGFVNESPRFTGEQSTFMLDEELELEQTTVRKDSLSLNRRLDDEEDGIDVNGQDVQRLIIVTQDIRTDKDDIGAKESEPISDELATAINDGLYFYEQELRAKQSNSPRNNSGTEMKDGDSKSSATAHAFLNSKANTIIAGNNGSEETGHANSRMQQTKDANKSLSSQKQRLFSNNFRGHGNGRIHHGIMSESPPSNSVGFFFGSTPPENHGLMSATSSGSPHGILPGSSPPVGSLPKPTISASKSSAFARKRIQATKVPEVPQALSK